MKLTKEQYDALAPYETQFITATKSQWARHPGRAALDIMCDTLEAVTGHRPRRNHTCNVCVLNIITEMGSIWLADKVEVERKKATKAKKEKKA